MLGHWSAEAQAAAAMANAWLFGTLLVATGVLGGLQPVISAAHGAGDEEECGRALWRGLLIGAALTVVVLAAWAMTPAVLSSLGQAQDLVGPASRYALIQLPSVPFVALALVLQQDLQARTLVLPAMWTALATNVLNLGFNWTLIFGKLGAPALGLVGAAWATTLTRILGVGFLVALLVWKPELRRTWRRFGPAVLDGAALRAILALGVPIALRSVAVVWAIHGSTLIVGRLRPEALAPQAILLNAVSVGVLLAVGFGGAAAIRAGIERGAGRADRAPAIARAALLLGVGLTAPFALGSWLAPHTWIGVYTGTASAAKVVAQVWPWALAYLLANAVQAVLAGVLRGLGHTLLPALATAAGLWLVAIPLSATWLAAPGAGLADFWRGFALGPLLGSLGMAAMLWQLSRSAQRSAASSQA